MLRKPKVQIAAGLTALSLVLGWQLFVPTEEEGLYAVAQLRPFRVEVNTVGELEAERSLTISSSIRAEQAKIIDMIQDGQSVGAGELLMRLDPTPFQEKVAKLQAAVQDSEGQIAALRQSLELETQQAEKELHSVRFEIESAELELQKVRDGDGPMEQARLAAAMHKARGKFEELSQYAEEVESLYSEGYLTVGESRQAQKKLKDAEEEFRNTEQQYNTYVKHVHPMQVKRAESQLRRCRMLHTQAEKAATIRITKAHAAIGSAEKSRALLLTQLAEAERALANTEIRAPSPGMVVLRRQHHPGGKRPVRPGDSVHAHQPLIDLPDLSQMLVQTKVREIDLSKVRVGRPCWVEVDAYPGLRLFGRVHKIGVLAMSEMGNRRTQEKYFQITCSIDEGHPGLRPGMTARVTVEASPERESLTVPAHAVQKRGEQNYLCVREGRRYRLRPVEVGESNAYWTEVSSGLQEGECVALTLPERLREQWERQV